MERVERERTIEFHLPRLFDGEQYWMVKAPDEPAFIISSEGVELIELALRFSGYDLGLTEFFPISSAEALSYVQLKMLTPFKYLFEREVSGFLYMEFEDGEVIIEKLWYGHQGAPRVQELRERAVRSFWFPSARYGEYADYFNTEGRHDHE